MYSAVQKIDMYYALMNEIGLAVNPMGLVVDQDSGIQIKSNSLNIRYVQPGVPVVAMPGETIFDPLNNLRMMNHLFGYYWDKEASMGNGSLREYYPTGIKRDGGKEKTNITAITNEGEVIQSGYYFNASLKYMDIILKRAGYMGDLSIFDEDVIE